jgi:DNA invertase Pin-like site-specific DNA recombinase
MYYTVKTLLEHGKSVSAISRELSIDRKTVRKLRDKVQDGVKPPVILKPSILDPYKDVIVSLMEEGLSGVLVHRRLRQDYELDISYSCVKKYVRKLKAPDGPYVPLITPPAYFKEIL